MDDGQLLYMQNEHYPLVDALPYIDTQLGQTEVAQRVKALIDEEMRHFEPRDYLASLPAPELPFLSGEVMTKEFSRIEAGEPMKGIDVERYKVETPQGPSAGDHGAWKRQAELMHLQTEYNRLRLTNLEMLERWGTKAWIAHSCLVRASEQVLRNEANTLRASREEVNKKRKLDQVSCGNELRKYSHELDRYMQDNTETEAAVRMLDAEVQRLRQAAVDRGVPLDGIGGHGDSVASTNPQS